MKVTGFEVYPVVRGPGHGFTLREDVAGRHAPQGPQPGTIRSY